MASLVGKVCLVTGASRGIGKGIATQLVKNGATCYITARNGEALQKLKVQNIDSEGEIRPCVCDHSNDDQVEKLFRKIKNDSGRLDLLVNNAFQGLPFISDHHDQEFWKQGIKSWEEICNVGLRSNFVAAVLASDIMVKQKYGIIVNVSAIAGAVYVHSPLYGVGKCAIDRMARDCAIQLRKHNVAFLSYWPSAVNTEFIREKLSKGDSEVCLANANAQTRFFMKNGQTTESCGDAFVKILSLPHKKVMKMSGNTIASWNFAKKHKLTYGNGQYPINFLTLKSVARAYGFEKLSYILPGFFGLPLWTLKPIYDAYRLPFMGETDLENPKQNTKNNSKTSVLKI